MGSGGTRVAAFDPGDHVAGKAGRGHGPSARDRATHHAYDVADSGQEFLISDRVIVTFHQPPSADQLGAFAGKYGLIKREAYSDRRVPVPADDAHGHEPSEARRAN